MTNEELMQLLTTPKPGVPQAQPQPAAPVQNGALQQALVAAQNKAPVQAQIPAAQPVAQPVAPVVKPAVQPAVQPVANRAAPPALNALSPRAQEVFAPAMAASAVARPPKQIIRR